MRTRIPIFRVRKIGDRWYVFFVSDGGEKGEHHFVVEWFDRGQAAINFVDARL